jgi:hypothetical protein
MDVESGNQQSVPDFGPSHNPNPYTPSISKYSGNKYFETEGVHCYVA